MPVEMGSVASVEGNGGAVEAVGLVTSGFAVVSVAVEAARDIVEAAAVVVVVVVAGHVPFMHASS